jgi:hypothetical protein
MSVRSPVILVLCCNWRSNSFASTRIGPFGIDGASGFTEAGCGYRGQPLDRVVTRCFTTLMITGAQANFVRNGPRLTNLTLPVPTTALLTQQPMLMQFLLELS